MSKFANVQLGFLLFEQAQVPERVTAAGAKGFAEKEERFIKLPFQQLHQKTRYNPVNQLSFYLHLFLPSCLCVKT